MPLPCTDHPLSDATCRFCWLWAHNPTYRALWGDDPTTATTPTVPIPFGNPPAKSPSVGSHPVMMGAAPAVEAPPARFKRCIHEGAVREFCAGCSGEMAEWRHVRDCELHEKCTRGVVSDKVQSCQTCPDYLPDA